MEGMIMVRLRQLHFILSDTAELAINILSVTLLAHGMTLYSQGGIRVSESVEIPLSWH